MPTVIHSASIPLEVEIDAYHQDEMYPEAQSIRVLIPFGAGVKVTHDAAGRSWLDITSLVITDGQTDAWTEVEAVMRDADAGILESDRDERMPA